MSLMHTALVPVRAILLAAVVTACGDDDGNAATTIDASLNADAGAPDGPSAACTGDFRACLAATPGVVSVEERVEGDAPYLHVGITQPVDHDAPEAGTFVQYANLLVADPAGPTVLVTSGYYELYLGTADELTASLGANQIALEHRFFGDSIPAGDLADWTKLTVRQAAADQHRVVEILKPLLPGRWLSTGTSKGGMTAIFHRRFYPDDVDGTVPVSAPISFDLPDYRYDAFLETIGDDACRDALITALVAMLDTHRVDFIGRTEALAASAGGHFETRSATASFENAVVWLYWGFWQYGFDCSFVPGATATADELWDFLNFLSYPAAFMEENRGIDAEPYLFQAVTELGLQGFQLDALTPHLQEPVETDEAFTWSAAYPITPPAYSNDTMEDIQSWLAEGGTGFAFLYGEYDPWAGARFELGAAADSLLIWAPRMPHGFYFSDLEVADRAAFFAKLEAWSGVVPEVPNPQASLRLRARRLTLARELARYGQRYGVMLP